MKNPTNTKIVKKICSLPSTSAVGLCGKIKRMQEKILFNCNNLLNNIGIWPTDKVQNLKSKVLQKIASTQIWQEREIQLQLEEKNLSIWGNEWDKSSFDSLFLTNVANIRSIRSQIEWLDGIGAITGFTSTTRGHLNLKERKMKLMKNEVYNLSLLLTSLLSLKPSLHSRGTFIAWYPWIEQHKQILSWPYDTCMKREKQKRDENSTFNEENFFRNHKYLRGLYLDPDWHVPWHSVKPLIAFLFEHRPCPVLKICTNPMVWLSDNDDGRHVSGKSFYWKLILSLFCYCENNGSVTSGSDIGGWYYRRHKLQYAYVWTATGLLLAPLLFAYRSPSPSHFQELTINFAAISRHSSLQ